MMALLFVFQTVTFTLHKCYGDRNADGSSPGQRFSTNADGNSGKRKTELFNFDPNTISLNSLQRLGFSRKQALTIIHYREKGGRFRKREDFSKMYTVSPEKYEELAPYISIPQQSERKNYSQSPPPEHSVKTSQPKIRKEEKARHIFSHIEWEMTAYRVTFAAEAETELPEGYVWASPEELKTRYSLPSAFGKWERSEQ